MAGICVIVQCPSCACCELAWSALQGPHLPGLCPLAPLEDLPRAPAETRTLEQLAHRVIEPMAVGGSTEAEAQLERDTPEKEGGATAVPRQGAARRLAELQWLDNLQGLRPEAPATRTRGGRRAAPAPPQRRLRSLPAADNDLALDEAYTAAKQSRAGSATILFLMVTGTLLVGASIAAERGGGPTAVPYLAYEALGVEAMAAMGKQEVEAKDEALMLTFKGYTEFWKGQGVDEDVATLRSTFREWDVDDNGFIAGPELEDLVYQIMDDIGAGIGEVYMHIREAAGLVRHTGNVQAGVRWQ